MEEIAKVKVAAQRSDDQAAGAKAARLRVLAAALVLTASLSLKVSAVRADNPPPTNLLTNTAFDDKNGKGIPDGWQVMPAGNGTTTALSLEKTDGGMALKLVDHDRAVGVGVAQYVSVIPGRQYAFSAEVSGGTAFIYLRFCEAQGKPIDPEFRAPGFSPNGWRRKVCKAVAPPGAARVMAWFYTTSTGISDTLVRNPDLHDNGIVDEEHGPLMTDAQFFAALNLDYPGMEATRAAVAKGDLEAAKTAYLEFRQTRSKARWHVDPAAKPAAAVATTDAAGDRVLQHMIAMPWGNDLKAYPVGEKIDWTYNPLKPNDPAYTREWTYIALNRMMFWSDLGNAYWKTLDEKYAREWVSELTGWIHDNPVPMDADPGDTLMWRTLEAGIRMSGTWPDAYYHFLNSPSFTPDAHTLYAESAYEHAQRMERVLEDFPDHGGNWVTMECNGLCTVGLLFPEWKDSAGFVKAAFDRLDHELSAQVYPDGGQMELSTMYHEVARDNFIGLVKTAKLNAAPIPPDYLDKLKSMYVWDLSLMDQEGLLPPVNDVTGGIVRVSKVMPEALDLWGGEEFRFGATLGKEGKAPPTSSLLPYSGYFAMRSGWKRDDVYLFFDGGPVGTGHWHEDKLNIYLKAYGRTLLTEAGGYAYDQSPMRYYVLSTPAHNTITVDGKDQHRGGEGKPEITPARVTWNPRTSSPPSRLTPVQRKLRFRSGGSAFTNSKRPARIHSTTDRCCRRRDSCTDPGSPSCSDGAERLLMQCPLTNTCVSSSRS